MRHYFRLARLVDALLRSPLKAKDSDIQALLLLGLYQLTQMRVPDHAAVSETVAATAELKKPWARGLVNGVLRNFQRQREQLLQQAEADEEGYWLHPRWLINALRESWPDDWQAILQANNQAPPMTLRVNLRQIRREDYRQHLQSAGIAAIASPQTPTALYLAKPVDVQELPGFSQGLVSVQDEAAQQAASLLQLQDGQRVLDICAAPGGKTGHILEAAAVEVVALDVDARRLQRVGGNLSRLGFTAELLCGDAAQPDAWWDGRPFDRILLDAPCSASGVIRRHPDIKLLRRATDISPLVKVQANILSQAWTLLKPGGILLYATCSVLAAENEQQIQAFVAKHKNARLLEINPPGGRKLACGWQILPGEGGDDMSAQGSAGMDGFYYACLQQQ
jgi:16S rRNA (cytosine967-C5)-methyltransferase